MPARRAMATTWMMALVEPPIAMCTLIALSKAAGVRIFDGVKSSHTMSTIRRPETVAMREWFESGAGIEEKPGSVRPRVLVFVFFVVVVPFSLLVSFVRVLL